MNVDNTENINTVEWFFGYGGNHLGIKRVLPGLRLVAACEIESYAVANAMSKMETGRLDSCPIWTDCKTFPTKPFENRELDLFIASYPCQPFSAAGQRKGADDERHLWPYVLNFVEKTRPSVCFFENVEGHVSLGLREVLTDLAKIGYRVENDCGEPTWGIFSAGEVGAPHQRKRVFVMAYSEGQRTSGEARCSVKKTGGQRNPLSWKFERPDNGTKLADTGLFIQEKQKQQATVVWQQGSELANTRSIKFNGEPKPEKWNKDIEVGESGHAVAHADSQGSQGHKRKRWIDEERWQIKNGSTPECRDIWPSRPGEPQQEWEEPRVVGNATKQGSQVRTPRQVGGCGETEPKLERSARDSEREIESIVGRAINGNPRGVDPNRNRIDRLRMCGNGVVPATVEKAFITLWDRILNPDEKKRIRIQSELF